MAYRTLLNSSFSEYGQLSGSAVASELALGGGRYVVMLSENYNNTFGAFWCIFMHASLTICIANSNIIHIQSDEMLPNANIIMIRIEY